jgi:hypothetical protein
MHRTANDTHVAHGLRTVLPADFDLDARDEVRPGTTRIFLRRRFYKLVFLKCTKVYNPFFSEGGHPGIKVHCIRRHAEENTSLNVRCLWPFENPESFTSEVRRPHEDDSCTRTTQHHPLCVEIALILCHALWDLLP